MKALWFGFLAASLCLIATDRAGAWGRAGFAGVRVGGYGGYRAGGFAGYRAGGYGGYRAGAWGGYHAGYAGYRGAYGYRGYGVGGYRGAYGYRGYGVGGYRTAGLGYAGTRIGLGTDFGLGHVAWAGGARGFVGLGHYTPYYSGGLLAARAAAVRTGFFHYGYFGPGWWGAHPLAWRPAVWGPAVAWSWVTWPTLVSWLGWSAPPVYYNYGDNITYQDNEVYSEGQPVATADQYYQQAATLADTEPKPEPADTEWKPLGVFSLVQGDQSDTSAVFQLAVNKAGQIRGNYFNVLTDTNLQVHGAVDPKTQRAAWTVGDNKTTVYDSGLFNLTKEQTPVLIHFGKDRTQEWLLVRMKDKDAKPAAGEAAPADPAEGTGTARVTVLVPADAQVFFDGATTTDTGSKRLFVTPALEKGKDYYYSIRADWTEDGQPVEQTRRVLVKAGSDVQVRLGNSSP
jgi:uncharacterized protein (TIGR03000 family)